MLDERTLTLPLKDGDFPVEACNVWRQGGFFPLFLPYSLIHPPGERLAAHKAPPFLECQCRFYRITT